MFMKSALVALGGATLAAAVTPLEVQGSQFVDSKTGNAFQVVGMAYQIGGSAGYDPSHGKDPLSNGDICKRDAALMQQLGINTVRVYNLDPNLNHDDCASVFNAAGMYMIIDVNSPLEGESLRSDQPKQSYNSGYLNRTFAIVEAFKSYPNTLGFFSGNEVINDVKTGSSVPPYVRAVTRDLKNYIKNHADRAIPVGYSAADVRDVLEDTWNYFQCAIDGDADDMSRADMFALNSYSWCGDSSFQKSGYDTLVDMFKTTSVPVFYSEFGCNTPSPRVFTEIGTIYGSQMAGVFSGGVVYEWAQEDNNYGLATCNDDGTVELLSDYKTLQDQYKKVDFTKVQSVKAANSKVTAPTCKSSLIKEKGFANDFDIPAVPSGAQSLIDDGVSPAPSGKIVDISDYTVNHQVKDASGNVIQGLAVKPLADDETNASGTSSSSSDSTHNAAATLAPQGALSAAAIIVPAIVALSFTAGFSLI
ncbi:glycoside hydrolase family 72 protein [Hypoxylon trugodes]|uniref:glycoside hydrolase family 72 protein n=1 Tax=Hypoxylon trugodes TaxID=326681 RepID=UPI00219E1144|nr:glycoside hydrolase family 72 protein [Hypoxylon trugodes]KAI1389050.1 glycoside hydrolase family 72 protein [Hypoxylon trugodes]